MTQTQIASTQEKFHSAEQLWFWFLYSKSIQNGYIHGQKNQTRRPCELLDVETLITKLYLCGKLNDEQLFIMKKFGDRRRAPHQHIWSENRAASLWRSAMNTIEEAISEYGWLDK